MHLVRQSYAQEKKHIKFQLKAKKKNGHSKTSATFLTSLFGAHLVLKGICSDIAGPNLYLSQVCSMVWSKWQIISHEGRNEQDRMH